MTASDLYDQVQQLNTMFQELRAELALTRQHLNEIQQWQDTTQAFLVTPALKEEEEVWKEAMREGMV